MSLVVAKNIKALFKQRGIKTSQSAISSLNKEVEKLCLKAVDKVEADRLKIVKSGHIPQLDALLDSSIKLSRPDSPRDL